MKDGISAGGHKHTTTRSLKPSPLRPSKRTCASAPPNVRSVPKRTFTDRAGVKQACLLAVIPDIGSELPIASDLFPHHEIFAGNFLRRPHRACGTAAAPPPAAISCLGAFRTPAASARGRARDCRRPKTCPKVDIRIAARFSYSTTSWARTRIESGRPRNRALFSVSQRGA